MIVVFSFSFYNKIYRLLKTMGLVQLLTALYSYRFTSNVRRKIKAKPLMTPRLHPLALAAGWERPGRGKLLLVSG